MTMVDRGKVIKGLEVHIKPNSKCVGCPYPNNGLCGDQLYHDALELLKEQEPKQVIGIADSFEGMEVGYCPSCDKSIVNRKIDETKFCRYCGRAVKWDG